MWLPGQTLEHVERETILAALKFCNWHRQNTADALKVSLRTITNRVAQYRAEGMQIPDSKWELPVGLVTDEPPVATQMDMLTGKSKKYASKRA